VTDELLSYLIGLNGLWMPLKLHHTQFRHYFFKREVIAHNNYFFAITIDNANIDIEKFWVKKIRE
jgi:hypothetical protein